MKKIRALLAWLFMFLFCFGLAMVGMSSRHPGARVAAAVQQEDPHANQPDHCTNAKKAPAAHKCDCKKAENACDVEDRKCRVYCRKNHCHCFHPGCDS